jgi:hypothetical protein
LSGLAVFAYASLVDPASARQTLGHEVEPAPARLPGWRRRWSVARDNRAAEKTFALVEDGSLPRFCLGLNIERVDGAPAPNGALIGVSAADLVRLDRRELRYDRVDVTEALDERPPGVERVFAYTSKPERFAAEPPQGAVILAPYVRTVEAAFARLGVDQLDAYRRTTEAPPVAVVEGVLIADRIPPGNPRKW